MRYKLLKNVCYKILATMLWKIVPYNSEFTYGCCPVAYGRKCNVKKFSERKTNCSGKLLYNDIPEKYSILKGKK